MKKLIPIILLAAAPALASAHSLPGHVRLFTQFDSASVTAPGTSPTSIMGTATLGVAANYLTGLGLINGEYMSTQGNGNMTAAIIGDQISGKKDGVLVTAGLSVGDANYAQQGTMISGRELGYRLRLAHKFGGNNVFFETHRRPIGISGPGVKIQAPTLIGVGDQIDRVSAEVGIIQPHISYAGTNENTRSAKFVKLNFKLNSSTQLYVDYIGSTRVCGGATAGNGQIVNSCASPRNAAFGLWSSDPDHPAASFEDGWNIGVKFHLVDHMKAGIFFHASPVDRANWTSPTSTQVCGQNSCSTVNSTVQNSSSFSNTSWGVELSGRW